MNPMVNLEKNSNRNRVRPYAVPSLAEIFFVSLLLFLCFQPNSKLLTDGDTAFHIRIGQHILKTHTIPKTDIFSFHEPKPEWVAHEWLSEVIMALAYEHSGISGVVVLYAFLIAFQTYLLFIFLQRYSENIIFVSIVMLLTLASSLLHWLARPHVFSLLLFLIWYSILERYHHASRNYLWYLPLMMVFWVNLHGGYLAGLILNAIFIIGNFFDYTVSDEPRRYDSKRKFKNLLFVTMACLVATLINPNGYRMLLFPFTFMKQEFMIDHTPEFLSPDFHSAVYISFELTLLLLFSVFFLSNKRIQVVDLGLLVAFLHLSLFARRYIPLFGIIAAPVLLKHSTDLRYFTANRIYHYIVKKASGLSAINNSAKGFLWALLASVMVLVALAHGFIKADFNRNEKPIDAIEFINQEAITGHMFNGSEFGDFLLTYAYPKYSVFIDGRADMYGAELLKDYINVIAIEPGWEDILAKYSVTWIFFPTDSVLTRHLKLHRDWVMIYSDPVASIFLKDTTANQSLIQRFSAPIPD